MADLEKMRCVPCEGGVPPLAAPEVERLLGQLRHWRLSADGRRISRTVELEDFHRVMALVNAIAWIAHQQDHHPDLEVSYRRCVIHYTTHAISGLSENDFICAAKVEALLTA